MSNLATADPAVRTHPPAPVVPSQHRPFGHPSWCDLDLCTPLPADDAQLHCSQVVDLPTAEAEIKLQLLRGTLGPLLTMVATEHGSDHVGLTADLIFTIAEVIDLIAQLQAMVSLAGSGRSRAHVELGGDGQSMVTLSCGGNTVVCTTGEAIHLLTAASGSGRAS